MGGGIPVKSGKKVRRFLDARKSLINQLLDFITHKLRVFNRLLEIRGTSPLSGNEVLFNLNENYTGIPVPAKRTLPSNLKWIKSDVDLLELINALYESESIIKIGSKLNKKDLQSAFELMFNHPIKDSSSKLSRLKDRKKDLTPFMDYLRQSLHKYLAIKHLIND